MILNNLPKLQHGNYTRKKQDSSEFIEYWPKREVEDGIIDWSKSSQEIHTLIRAVTHPYPGAYTIFNGLKLIIWNAEFSNEKSNGIGKIMDVNNSNVKIGTGKGVIILKNVSYNNHEKVSMQEIFTKDDVNSIIE